jgi:hypothetical protein
MIVPPSDRNLARAKDLFEKSSSGRAAWKWVEITSRPGLKKSFPRLPILDKKRNRDEAQKRHCYQR